METILDDAKETVKITASDEGMKASPRPRKKCKVITNWVMNGHQTQCHEGKMRGYRVLGVTVKSADDKREEKRSCFRIHEVMEEPGSWSCLCSRSVAFAETVMYAPPVSSLPRPGGAGGLVRNWMSSDASPPSHCLASTKRSVLMN